MAINKYIPANVEPKWQKKWVEDKLYRVDLSNTKKHQYILVEFSYPSGDLHMGHWFTFAVPDILARMRRMQGYNVFLPNGFDAFGLPAENAAIKRGVHPQDWTLSNIEKMKQQFATMGASYDWEHEVITCLPQYYRWNQWIFLKMYEKGLAYKGKAFANWCPDCQTVLANENVESGKCWRCGSEVVQKEVSQWFLKITDYAEKLLWSDSPSVDWPKPLREGQNNWIGKSEGVIIKFGDLEVFTTRPDTIYGATFLVLSPEHPLAKKLTTLQQKREVEAYVEVAKRKSEMERKEAKEKSGVFTGSYLTNPINKEKLPVWISDYVLLSYGTGAIMGVPAHDSRDFEFVREFNLEVRRVIEGGELPFEGEGKMVNSAQFNGLSSSEARGKISKDLASHQLGRKHIQYHLHDWSISRQRYWGTPIPIIYCDQCGVVPVPEASLPVELPYQVDYAPKGKPPLATAEDWVNVKCPKCKGDAKREVETMDTFIDSSWYFFRYLDPKNDQEIFDAKVIGGWMPLDIYFGGSEHTLGHALYSRFFTKFLHDLNLINFDEYAQKRVHHGLILGPDNQKMSKSRGNVVNPDEQVKSFGADAVRLYLSFIGPYDIVAPWNPAGVNGVYHFLQRVWGLFDKVDQELKASEVPADLTIMHKTIKKVTEDVAEIKLNTAVASLMEWLNHLSKKDRVSGEEYKTFLRLLSPFAPHLTEELWQMLGEKYSIHQQDWPRFEEKYLEGESAEVVVQVNGKVRATLVIQKEILNDRLEVEKKAREVPNVAKFLKGGLIQKTVYVPGKIINFVV